MDIRVIRTGRQRPRIRPVYLMCEPGVTFSEKEAVIEGIESLLGEARVKNKVEVKDFGVWRMGSGEYESVDWYINRARQAGRAGRGYGYQLNAANLIASLEREPWKKSNDHYDVLVCSSDLWDGTERTNFVIGLARPGDSTAFSVKRFRELRERMAAECIKTETIHELGHVFGLIPFSRKVNIEYSLRKHCTNVCSMRQGLRVPLDWVKYTQERLAKGALCPECRKDLRDYFSRGQANG